jgi:hypothetical protein
MRIAARPTTKTLLLLTAVYAVLIVALESEGFDVKPALTANSEFWPELISLASAAVVCWTIPFLLALVTTPLRVGVLCCVFGCVWAVGIWLVNAEFGMLLSWFAIHFGTGECADGIFGIVLFGTIGAFAISDWAFMFLPEQCRQPPLLYACILLGQVAYGLAGYFIGRTFLPRVPPSESSPAIIAG